MLFFGLVAAMLVIFLDYDDVVLYWLDDAYTLGELEVPLSKERQFIFKVPKSARSYALKAEIVWQEKIKNSAEINNTLIAYCKNLTRAEEIQLNADDLKLIRDENGQLTLSPKAFEKAMREADELKCYAVYNYADLAWKVVGQQGRVLSEGKVSGDSSAMTYNILDIIEGLKKGEKLTVIFKHSLQNPYPIPYTRKKLKIRFVQN